MKTTRCMKCPAMIRELVRQGVPHQVVTLDDPGQHGVEWWRGVVESLGYREVPVTVVLVDGVVVDHWSGVRPSKAAEYGLKF